MKNSYLLSATLFVLSPLALAVGDASGPSQADAQAQIQTQEDETAQLEKVVVTGVRQRLYEAGALKDTIVKTEVMDFSDIEGHQADTLAEAIALAPGVRVNNECSMCGVKRVMLNGLKGEHTNVLIDGIPAFTMLAGFYGMDAATTQGIERIEIARGAGASLTAPEAIGGVINLVTQTPTENSGSVDVAGGENDYKKVSAVGNLVNDAGNLGAMLSAQVDERDMYDADDNGVSESPYMKNEAFAGRISWDATNTDNLSIRLGAVTSEVFGGPVNEDIDSAKDSFQSNPDASTQLFENNDVRNKYIGHAWETTEWIKTEREEVSLSWLHEFNSQWNSTLNFSHNQHDQDSFYEGIDYAAENTMQYMAARINWLANEKHVLTFGVDHRDEEMRSDSEALAGNTSYIEDSFDYVTTGFYVQDTWTPHYKFDASLALRYDQVEADFVDSNKPGTEVSQSLFSPRIDMRYYHSEWLTSRFSAGRGYRAPLSFFETDHGILDAEKGFLIEVNELERSNSATYSLSYEGEKINATWSLAHTQVENLALLSETDDGVPLLTQLDDLATITATDVVLGYKLDQGGAISLTAEHFQYNDTFEQSYGVAPVEDRIILDVDLHLGQWELVSAITWVSSRNLEDYGYEGFNKTNKEDPKTTKAPDYYVVDFKLTRDITEQFKVYVGAANLLDYTQAGDEDSPLFYDADNGYDVAYIYGPLRGREAYAGLKLEF